MVHSAFVHCQIHGTDSQQDHTSLVPGRTKRTCPEKQLTLLGMGMAFPLKVMKEGGRLWHIAELEDGPLRPSSHAREMAWPLGSFEATDLPLGQGKARKHKVHIQSNLIFSAKHL